MDPNMDPSNPYRNRRPELTSNSNVAALVHSSQQYVAPENPLGLMRQSTHRSAALQPFPSALGNYPLPSQAVFSGNQVRVPGYGSGLPSESLVNEPSRRPQTSQSDHSGQGSPDPAASSSRPTVSQQQPGENNGLLFQSLDEALATTDQLFRTPLDKIVNDDVDEVERNKRSYVLKIIKALKHTGFLPPPDTKKGRRQTDIALDDKAKVKWQEWQVGANEAVQNLLKQPNHQANVEYHAWEIIEEMIKTHRLGFRFTNQGKDITSKCSERIDIAIQTIKDYAIVRMKLLNGDKVSDFCVGPNSYALKTIASHRNNSTRPSKKSDVDESTLEPKRRRKTPARLGAMAHRFQSRRDVRARKRSAKSRGNAEIDEAEDTRTGPDDGSEALRSNSETSPNPEEGEGLEEGDEGGDEGGDAAGAEEDVGGAAEDDVEDDAEDPAEEDEDPQAEEESEGQTAAPYGAYQQSHSAVFRPVNSEGGNFLLRRFSPVGPGFDYLPEFGLSSQQPARFENASFQASAFGPSIPPSIPSNAWSMGPQFPTNYAASVVSSVGLPVTRSGSGSMGLQPGVYPPAQGRQPGYGSPFIYGASSTGLSAMPVPSTTLSEPYGSQDTDQAPPPAKRRKN